MKTEQETETASSSLRDRFWLAHKEDDIIDLIAQIPTTTVGVGRKQNTDQYTYENDGEGYPRSSVCQDGSKT